MPKFDTPDPITVSLDLALGSVRVRASARSDTRVEVRPRNPQSDQDVQAAAQAQVEYASGRLRIHIPRNRLTKMFGNGPNVEIDLELPEGSELDAAGYADYRCEGRLGPVAIQHALGDVRIEHAGRLRVRSSTGDIRIGRADGPVDLHTATGAISVGAVGGTGWLKSSTGELRVGEATGDLWLKTATGDITIEHAAASVDAMTPTGAIRVSEVGGGTVTLQTGGGEVEVGVPEGVAAWLDLNAKRGRVRSELDAAGDPAPADKKVEVRASTGYGDILVRRA